MTVTIAVQAALLVIGLGVEEYREVSAVIVYPSSMVSRGEHAGPVAGTVSDGPIPILGEAHDRRGPVLLAWDQVERSSRSIGTGHNVVLHEFAHKLDMLDGVLNGSPPLGDRVDPDRWRGLHRSVHRARQRRGPATAPAVRCDQPGRVLRRRAPRPSSTSPGTWRATSPTSSGSSATSTARSRRRGPSLRCERVVR